MTNNNNSDKIYVIVGVACFLCFISSGGGLLIRYITKSDTSKKSQSPSSTPSSTPGSSPVTQKQDCVFEWEYGTKDESEGKQLKTYNLITESSGGGISCQYDDGDQVIEDVKVNCGGGWGGWSGCSNSCGPGTQTRTWNMTYGPKNGGDACPPTESKSCNLKSCKTCQSNSLELGYLSAYNLDSSYSACPKITDKSECENLKVNWGMGYRERVCDWK